MSAQTLDQAIADILALEPACDQGMCYYQRFDGEGKGAGIEHVDPVALLGDIFGRLRELQLSPIASAAELTLEQMYDLFHIGLAARDPHTLLVNVSNAARRSECLSRIESEFTEEVPGEYPDEPTASLSVLPWGAEPGEYLKAFRVVLSAHRAKEAKPIPMLLFCPKCLAQHVDAPEPDKGWTNPPHKSHLCHSCGTIWRPADVATVGMLDIVTCGENDNWQRPGWAEDQEIARDAALDTQRMSFCLTCGFPVRNQTPSDPGKTWVHPHGLHFGETALEAIDKARAAAIGSKP